MKNILAFIFGSIFALGLSISGMANPEKVLDFLDITGTWDPSLAFVMIGAILVAIIPFQKALRSAEPKTVFHETIELPTNQKIDSKLIMGALIFGMGWGIAGICPAPGLTLIGLGHYESFYFILAMLAGVFVHRNWFE